MRLFVEEGLRSLYLWSDELCIRNREKGGAQCVECLRNRSFRKINIQRAGNGSHAEKSKKESSSFSGIPVMASRSSDTLALSLMSKTTTSLSSCAEEARSLELDIPESPFSKITPLWARHIAMGSMKERIATEGTTSMT